MKLTIKTIFGERTFDIPESVATDLIEQAEEACADNQPIKVKYPESPKLPDFPKGVKDCTDDYFQGYKGFLYIKCEKCGKTKGYCTSRPLTYHKCECRHNTPLIDLASVKADCKCGEHFTYKTNVVDPQFSMKCMACGSHIDLELDGHGLSYVTMK